MRKTQPTLLCILDGFGLNPNPDYNAVHLAKKPCIDSLFSKYPWSTLTTFGEAVGLPSGQMGNSEVGHLNIGAGRVVEQWLLRINRALSGNFLENSSVYKDFISGIKDRIHIIGLYSDGGVHSHREHLHLLLKKIRVSFKGQIFLHLITDGRDTAPQIASQNLQELLNIIKSDVLIEIASISGRFYAMDRDKRWERTKLATDAIALGQGIKITDPIKYIQESYKKGINDEFIEPAVLSDSKINPEDGLVFWNFREDRMRQIVASLCSDSFQDFPRQFTPPMAKQILCFTEYDHKFNLPFLFPIIEIKNHIGEWLASLGKQQLRIAETEKYPHVTYFFNGGIEKEYQYEERIMLPSPRDVRTYDLKPQMSAEEVCKTTCDAISKQEYDLIVVNFANCDMVGHTGNLNAAITAVETVDKCLGQIIPLLEKHGGKAVIIADHGNCEQMIDYETGNPHTSHTTYPVPIILIGTDKNIKIKEGSLSDVAPTLLKLMRLSIPKEMTGNPLF
jgi:2,3-bisphosphoglycerate-independent phosphoglycerate mutase